MLPDLIWNTIIMPSDTSRATLLDLHLGLLPSIFVHQHSARMSASADLDICTGCFRQNSQYLRTKDEFFSIIYFLIFFTILLYIFKNNYKLKLL